MKQALLLSKPLGLRLLRALPPDGAMVIHPDDTGDARSVLPEIAAYCHSRDIPFRVVGSRAEADATLRAFTPDIAFVCGWYWLFSEQTRALCPFYGIHNSLLPKYRGGAPLVWAIINGEREVGSTLFQLGPGIDDGPIAGQVRIDLPRTATIADASAMIEDRWEAAFPAAWRSLCDGTLALIPQEGEATRFPNRKPDDGLIDWTLPAAKVHDFIRAQSAPYPGAFSGGLVFDASSEEPGPGVAVVCGDGKVLHVRTRRHQLVA